LKFFRVEMPLSGVAVATFDRPPVNAASLDVLYEIAELARTIERDNSARVLVLTAPEGARAWCGGADVNEFLGFDYDARMHRYRVMDECMPLFYNLSRPIIAAVNAHAVGFGVVFASHCDIRVASEEATFSTPEIDRGVLAAGGAFLLRHNMPLGKVREMVFTGMRYSARDMERFGFVNYVVPPSEVMPKALELAAIVASKSMPALTATKLSFAETEHMTWEDAYRATHEISARLTVGADAKEGIRAFLERREPEYRDR
jgi:enoyl-CoA hydratase/carnithine racemase